jgi:membrane protein
MYRFLPNTRVEWRDVWVGATATSCSSISEKSDSGFISENHSSSYGAAGSILVLLLWIYYSGLIFYFGRNLPKPTQTGMGRGEMKAEKQTRLSAPRNVITNSK